MCIRDSVSAGGYSGQQGAVLVLSFPKGDLVGTLTGFSVPSGECVDESGDVFVADGGADTIREYAHGGTTPIATLNDPGEPYGCSVDPTTGNLAVTNGSDSVAIYPSAQGTPTLYSDPSIYESVSYTHLDVYKRQVSVRSKRSVPNDYESH